MALETVALTIGETWTLISNSSGPLYCRHLRIPPAIFFIGTSAPAADRTIGMPFAELNFATLDAKVWARAEAGTARLSVIRVIDAANHPETP